MKKFTVKTSLLLLLTTTAFAEVQWVTQPAKQTLVTPTGLTVAKGSHQQPVVFNQSLLGQAKSVNANQGFLAKSKQFWLDTNGAELKTGVSIPVSSTEAVIRINPLATSGQQKHLDGAAIELSMAGNRLEPSLLVNAAQLKATGMSVGDHTVAFKVPTVPGNLMLKVNGIEGQAEFVVHVFEPASDYELTLSTNQQNYATGADMEVNVVLHDAQQKLATQVSGYISQPNGEKYADLTFNPDSQGGYKAVVPALQGMSLNEGLWEVHTITQGSIKGQKILRDASTAFAVDMPTARFSGALKMVAQHLDIGIENAVPARYEVSGVLVGRNQAGVEQPIALMMSAKWLETGTNNIRLAWPLDLIEASGLSAPFELQSLRLKNQSLMVPVQSVSQGLRIQQAVTKPQDRR